MAVCGIVHATTYGDDMDTMRKVALREARWASRNALRAAENANACPSYSPSIGERWRQTAYAYIERAKRHLARAERLRYA